MMLKRHFFLNKKKHVLKKKNETELVLPNIKQYHSAKINALTKINLIVSCIVRINPNGILAKIKQKSK